MGRSCMRGTPCSWAFAPINAKAAVSGRMAVPALPMNKSKLWAGAWPFRPVMRTVPPSTSTLQPIWRNAASMTRVSSESSRSCKVVVPSHKAASNSTRLEMLFEPGKVTVPWALDRAGTSRKAVLNISVFLALASRGCRLAQLPSASDLAGLGN
jgi:hypothetical protein